MIGTPLVILLTLIFLVKMILAFRYYLLTKKTLEQVRLRPASAPMRPIQRIVLLIPVLREQNILTETIEFISHLHRDGLNVVVAFAGTVRERTESNQQRNRTKESFDAYIQNNPHNDPGLHFFFFEAEDRNHGDRASQLNHALRELDSNGLTSYDVLGVYDADSRPDSDTLLEIKDVFSAGAVCAQQSASFVDTAKQLSESRTSSLMVANALYQTTWTVIREWPRWIDYAHWSKTKPNRSYPNCLYLIGHGEFFTRELIHLYGFPEREVTDGIQLGYRIGFTNVSITPLQSLCHDGVPSDIRQLVFQHKRWFGGCMRIGQAYRWSTEKSPYRPVLQALNCFWSQALWAFSAPVTLAVLIYTMLTPKLLFLFFTNLVLVSFYSYVLPQLSLKLLQPQARFRFMDWLLLPVAIFVKSFGPLLYLLESLFSLAFPKHRIAYAKVER